MKNKLISEVTGYRRPHIFASNLFKEFKDFIISYNPWFDETALIVEEADFFNVDEPGDTYFFILNGDFREVYEPLTLKEALLKFRKLSKNHLCKWSAEVEDVKKFLKVLNKK